MINKFDFMQEATRDSEINLSRGVALMGKIGEKMGLHGDGSDEVMNGILEVHGRFSEICKDILGELECRLSNVNPLATRLRKSESVHAFTQKAVRKGMNTERFFGAFVALARKRFKELFENRGRRWQRLPLPSNDICPEGSDNIEFSLLVQRNRVFNWLVVANLMESTEYDLLHQIGKEGAYNFSTKTLPNTLASKLVTYENDGGTVQIIDGKTVLSLGSGNGIDEKLFVENGAEVFLLDGSPFMIERQQDTCTALKRVLRPEFHVPEKPQDMFEVLEQMKAAGKQVDTIYGHSVTHYFDDSTLRRLFELVQDCLVEGGHFAFAVKAPGAVHDGNGIPLIIKENNVRVWLNEDGQSRFFRPLSKLVDIATGIGVVENRQFEFGLRVGRKFVIENYDVSGSSQTFFEIILKKIKKPERG